MSNATKWSEAKVRATIAKLVKEDRQSDEDRDLVRSLERAISKVEERARLMEREKTLDSRGDHVGAAQVRDYREMLESSMGDVARQVCGQPNPASETATTWRAKMSNATKWSEAKVRATIAKLVKEDRQSDEDRDLVRSLERAISKVEERARLMEREKTLDSRGDHVGAAQVRDYREMLESSMGDVARQVCGQPNPASETATTWRAKMSNATKWSEATVRATIAKLVKEDRQSDEDIDLVRSLERAISKVEERARLMEREKTLDSRGDHVGAAQVRDYREMLESSMGDVARQVCGLA